MDEQTIEYDGPTSPQNAFTHRETHPLVLDLLLIKQFKSEYLDWEPATLWREIQLTFNTTVSEVNKGRIQALRTCHVVDSPYNNWDVFDDVAAAFSGRIVLFDVVQRIPPHACIVAVDIMQKIKDTPITDEIWSYIAAVLLDDGTAYAPGSLSPCNRLMLKYVDANLQRKVADLVDVAARTDEEDSDSKESVQVMKSLSILDYAEFVNKQLLAQVDRIF